MFCEMASMLPLTDKDLIPRTDRIIQQFPDGADLCLLIRGA